MTDFLKEDQCNLGVFLLLAIFVIIYGPKLTTKLPKPIHNLFEKKWFRAVIIFAVVFMANKKPILSIVITIIFMILLGFVQNNNVLESFLQNYESNIENFSNLDLNKSNNKMMEGFEPCQPLPTINEDQPIGTTGCLNALKRFNCYNGQAYVLTTKNQTPDNISNEFTGDRKNNNSFLTDSRSYYQQLGDKKSIKTIYTQIKNKCKTFGTASNTSKMSNVKRDDVVKVLSNIRA